MPLPPGASCFCFIFPASGSLNWGRAKRLAVAFHPLRAVELIAPCSVMPCASVPCAQRLVHCFLSRRFYFKLAVDSDFYTTSVQITMYQPCQLCTGSPWRVMFFPCLVSLGFLNSAGVSLRFYSRILKGAQDWDHPNSTRTQVLGTELPWILSVFQMGH